MVTKQIEMGIEINADWLNQKIIQHYGTKKAFCDDSRNAFKYSTVSKHCSGQDKISDLSKHHYWLWFDYLDRL